MNDIDLMSFEAWAVVYPEDEQVGTLIDPDLFLSFDDALSAARGAASRRGRAVHLIRLTGIDNRLVVGG